MPGPPACPQALLTACAKLFFERPAECRRALGLALAAGAADADTEVHDRALLYSRLLRYCRDVGAVLHGGMVLLNGTLQGWNRCGLWEGHGGALRACACAARGRLGRGCCRPAAAAALSFCVAGRAWRWLAR